MNKEKDILCLVSRLNRTMTPFFLTMNSPMKKIRKKGTNRIIKKMC